MSPSRMSSCDFAIGFIELGGEPVQDLPSTPYRENAVVMSFIELGGEPIQDLPSTPDRENAFGMRFVELGGEPIQDVLMRFCNKVHRVRG